MKKINDFQFWELKWQKLQYQGLKWLKDWSAKMIKVINIQQFETYAFNKILFNQQFNK